MKSKREELIMKEYTKVKALVELLRTIPDYRVDIGKIKHLLAEVLFYGNICLIKGEYRI
jgi:hypothetical protein